MFDEKTFCIRLNSISSCDKAKCKWNKMVWCSNLTAYRRQEKCLNGLVSGSASWSMCVPIVEPEADGKLSLGHGPCLIQLTTTLYQLPIIISKLFLISDFNLTFFFFFNDQSCWWILLNVGYYSSFAPSRMGKTQIYNTFSWEVLGGPRQVIQLITWCIQTLDFRFSSYLSV